METVPTESATVDLVRQEWYSALVEDCKAIVTEAVFTSRWALVEGYWLLGQRVREDVGLKKWAQNEAGRVLQGLAKDIKVSTRTLYYALQFYDTFPDLSLLPEGKNISWNKVVTKYLPSPRETPELPEGTFSVVYADPPWDYDNSGLPQSAASHYPTMSVNQLTALPVPALCSPETVLFLWATSAMLPEALGVMGAWGFEYKAHMVWDKGRAPGIGWFLQTQHELLLIGTRGGNPHPKHKPVSVARISPTEHSAKPVEFYDTIEMMYDGPYVELFARGHRKGWEAWGDEV